MLLFYATSVNSYPQHFVSPSLLSTLMLFFEKCYAPSHYVSDLLRSAHILCPQGVRRYSGGRLPVWGQIYSVAMDIFFPFLRFPIFQYVVLVPAQILCACLLFS
jgi:hypothetical protein